MRKVVSLLVSLGLVATLGLVAAAPANATTPSANKVCSSLKSYVNNLIPTNGTKFDKKGAAAAARDLKNGSKSAPTKVRKALRKIASAYQALANGSSFIEVFVTGDLIGLAKAAGTIGTYYAKNCTNISIPTNG